MATWMDALAASLQGYAAGQDAQRQRELQEQALARQQQALDRQQAQEQAKQIRELMQGRFNAHDYGGAAALGSQYGEALKTGYGLDIAGPKLIPGQNGAPDWGNAANVAALGGFAGVQAPKPIEVSRNAALVDPRTGQALYEPPAPVQQPKVVSHGGGIFLVHPDGTMQTLRQPDPKPAPKGRAPAKPRLTWRMNADGSRTRVEDRPGVVSAKTPTRSDGSPFGGAPAPVSDPIAEWAAKKLKQNR